MLDYAEFDFGFEKVKVRIVDVKRFKTDPETGESYPFVEAKFEGLTYGIKTVHQCRQIDPMEDIMSDVKRIEAGKIRGTRFYKHWIKLFFKNRPEFTLIDDKEFVEFYHNCVYAKKQDSFKQNTIYFLIDGERTKIEGYYFEYDGKRYLL